MSPWTTESPITTVKASNDGGWVQQRDVGWGMNPDTVPLSGYSASALDQRGLRISLRLLLSVFHWSPLIFPWALCRAGVH